MIIHALSFLILIKNLKKIDMKKISKLPLFGDRGQHVEILQAQLVEAGNLLENVDGDFGNKTKSAIKRFQETKSLQNDGLLSTDNLKLLGIEVDCNLKDKDLESAIITIVDISDIEKTFWKNRGRAPYGYYYGMALSFAKHYLRLSNNDIIIKEISKSISQYEKFDSLKKWENIILSKSMDFDTPSNRLKSLHTLMLGLGMMESSGKYCCGWDRGKIDGWKGKGKSILPTSENSEAGLFQTSYDILGSVSLSAKFFLEEVINRYSANNDGLQHLFSKGVKCSVYDLENFGEGKGFEFQKLTKELPLFAVEFTALSLRNTSNHWNPVIKINDSKLGLEINSIWYELLTKIEDVINENDFEIDAVFTESFTPYSLMIPQNLSNQRKLILDKANEVGQKDALEKMFLAFPESKANFWATIDFNKPSSEERLFIFDVRNNKYKKYIVTHGKGSGDLFAKKFSNTPNSLCSSLGIYKTGKEYVGHNGRSLLINGIDSSNDNALQRKILIHSAE